MTARAEGEDVYLWKNADGSYEYVPKEGTEGADGVTPNNRGKTAIDANNRKTAGGGSGGCEYTSSSGSGSKGTSYSGGCGGGGTSANPTGVYATSGSINGGPGGQERNYSGGAGGTGSIAVGNISTGTYVDTYQNWTD